MSACAWYSDGAEAEGPATNCDAALLTTPPSWGGCAGGAGNP
eukprot:gene2631-6517_t